MPELIAKTALTGQGPLIRGGSVLSELPLVQITSVAPYPGHEAAASAVLADQGLGFPAANRVIARGDTRIVWAGRGQAFLFGAPAPTGLAAHAALTDQSDGWCGLNLAGATAADALMRLVPVDLRPAACPPGTALRTGLNHMQVLLIATGAGFDIFVFRSMARTAWHELAAVLDALAARAALR